MHTNSFTASWVPDGIHLIMTCVSTSDVSNMKQNKIHVNSCSCKSVLLCIKVVCGNKLGAVLKRERKTPVRDGDVRAAFAKRARPAVKRSRIAAKAHLEGERLVQLLGLVVGAEAGSFSRRELGEWRRRPNGEEHGPRHAGAHGKQQPHCQNKVHIAQEYSNSANDFQMRIVSNPSSGERPNTKLICIAYWS